MGRKQFYNKEKGEVYAKVGINSQNKTKFIILTRTNINYRNRNLLCILGEL